ncbi:hypothetical protein FY034_00770 [Trichlorobacter lovleyi]|uniref:cache domain-containing protein n=1 Tax=Trichlorobacter lovleyi TaxID=313985 RepID=UPI00223F271B|nr:cache domain-containing protein [Trichlorobacter lovleyi]QOX77533.1 hypothetical protein FY034_00770 [Trichlorobacter lovleyi]
MNSQGSPHGSRSGVTGFLLNRRLSLVVAAASFVTVLLLALGVAAFVDSYLKEKNGQSLAELAFHMSQTLDNGVYERFGDLLQISHRLDFRSLQQNPQKLRAYLEQQQRFFPEYAWLGFVRPDGTVLAGTGGMLERKNISAREWVQAGKQNPYAGDVHEAMLLSALLPQPQDGEPLRLIDLALPIYDDQNRLLGVMGAHLSWQWAKDIRKNLLSHNLDGREIEILILNSKGSVLLGSSGGASNGMDLSKLLSFRQAREFKVGSVSEQWPDGNRYTSGYARGKGRPDFNGLNWIVLARQSDAIVHQETSAIMQKAVLLGLLIGLLAGAGCWFSVSRALEPLQQIEEALARLDQDAATLPETLPTTRRDALAGFARKLYSRLIDMYGREHQLLAEREELRAELTQHFDTKAHLAELRRSLELRVLERTADLQDTNRLLEQQLEQAAATLLSCRQYLQDHPDSTGLQAQIRKNLELLRTPPADTAVQGSQTATEPSVREKL